MKRDHSYISLIQNISCSLSDAESLAVLRSIDGKMDKMIKMLALSAVANMDQINKIKSLHGMGLNSSEIAASLGIASSTVRVVLHRSKKSKKGDKNGK